ncbi:MAG: hypothetical protein IJG70_07190 [Kiritimatiellae bacterium]|nr:hypothetical protein [Kiritimatiellia bacterium]
MHHNIKTFAFLLCAALTAGAALAYEDDYVEVALGANGCVTRIDNGERIVYVFSNLVNTATISSTITLKQDMTLCESLVVGGGGAGGGFKGGGGGGGVVYSDTESFVSTGSEIELTVGAGGIGNINRKAAKPQDTGAGYGSPSSLTLAGITTTAYGGGGGGADKLYAPSRITDTVLIASGGGGAAEVSGLNVDGTYYTAEQGYYGGIGYGSKSTNRGTGGGGGAGSPGQNGANNQSGNGGEGVTNAITGVREVYGSGGGGGGAVSINSGPATPGIGGTNAGDGSQGLNSSTPTAGAGVPGFGGGGGGGGYGGYNGSTSAGGNGGSGTVILSFTAGGQAGQPTIDPNAITVEYTDGYTQPNLSITLGGDEGAVYTASLVVYCVTGSVEAAAGEWASTNVYEGLHLGDTGTGFATVYPLPGDTYTVKAIASAEGAVDAVAVKTFTVPDDQGLTLPPYLGKGGGPGVIHVRPGARGRGTGESWTDAYTDFRASLKLISEDRPELWFSGSDTLSSATAGTVSITNSAAIRGGFTGVENTIAERPANSHSTIDGVNAYTALAIANAAPATVDGFWICRGVRGLAKSGAGDITVTNCVFDSNGPGGTIAGRAMQLSGNATSTRATVADSIVMRHYETDTAGTAGAVYLTSLHEATVSACLFASNGLALATRSGSGTGSMLPGRSPGIWGAALAINGVKTLVENCQFRANVVPTIFMNDKIAAGGVARLRGNAGGSVFRNCLFTGNASIYGRLLSDSYPDPAGGALVVEMTAGQTVQVENCTFAYNLHSGENSAASLTVVSGAAAVTNTIFAGSICSTGRSSGHDAPPGDILVASGAAATVGFSLMSGAENRTAAEGGELVVGVGCIDADPLLVTEFSALSPYVYTGNNPGFMTTAGAVISALSAHLRGGRGYFDERTGQLDATYKSKDGSSPAIDAGNPASGYAREPDTRDGWHGRRINMGFYGNTPWATLSPFPGSAMYLR